MSKPLTLQDREDKGDVDPRSLDRFNNFPSKRNVRFPSYFDSFCNFSRFLTLSIRAALPKCRRYWEHQIPPAAANMAIV